MKSLILICLFSTFLFGKGQAQSILLKNARIVHIETGEISHPTQLLVKNGKIKAIGDKVGKNYSGLTEDLHEAFVLPGLIDAHVHISNDPKEQHASRVRHLKYFLQRGITTIRDAAGDARILKELQQEVRQGKIQGPDIYYAAFIAGPDYYKGNDREQSMVAGLDTTFAPWLQCIRPGDNLQQAMQDAKSCGATGIKIYGGFNREELFPLIKAARKEGLKIWGHATLFPAKPSDVAEAGMEVISHAYMLEWENVPEDLTGDIFKNYELFYAKIDHEHLNLSRFITAVKEREAIFDPTLYLCMINGMEWSAEVVKQAYKAGVKICAGTDYINDLSRPYPFLYDEIEAYVQSCGFTPLDAIRSASIIAAEAIGIEKQKGTIKTGKDADLLILDKNPLEDIKNLRSTRMVVKGGECILKK